MNGWHKMHFWVGFLVVLCLFSMGVSASIYDEVNNATLFYTLDDSSMSDYTGHGYTGLVGTSSSSAGYYNAGRNSTFRTNNISANNILLNTSFTFSTWIYTNNTPGSLSFLGNLFVTNQGWRLDTNTAYAIKLIAGGVTVSTTVPVNLTNNTWQYVTVRYNASNTTWSFFQNGTKKANYNQYFNVSLSNLTFGQDSPLGMNFDEVALYNQSLSDNAVQLLFNASVTNKRPGGIGQISIISPYDGEITYSLNTTRQFTYSYLNQTTQYNCSYLLNSGNITSLVGCLNFTADVALGRNNITLYFSDSGNVTQSTTSFYHYLSLIDNCSSYTTPFLKFYSFDENTYGTPLNTTVEVYINYLYTNGTDVSQVYNSNYTYFSGIFGVKSNYSFCLSNNYSIVNYNSYIKYNNTVYTHRNYILNQSYTGIAQETGGGDYQSSTGISKLQITLRDQFNYSLIPNVIGRLQRFYISEGVWRNVQMDKSGDYGVLSYDIRESDTDYRIVFTDLYNNIIKTTGTLKFVCTATVGGVNFCDLTYILNPSLASTITPDFNYNLTFNNVTGKILLNYTDNTGLTHTARLYVTAKQIGRSSVVCNITNTSAFGTILCDASTYNGSLTASVYSSASPERPITTQIYQFIREFSMLISNTIPVREGTFWSMGLVVVLMGAGLFSPVAAIIMTIFGLMIGFFIGLNNIITVPLFILACVLGIIVGLKVRA